MGEELLEKGRDGSRVLFRQGTRQMPGLLSNKTRTRHSPAPDSGLLTRSKQKTQGPIDIRGPLIVHFPN